MEVEWDEKEAQKLEAGARRALDALPVSMKALAELGRGLDDANRLRERGSARSAKVGRNESCPCGSGRKVQALLRASASSVDASF